MTKTLEQIEEELKPLYNQQSIIQKKIIKLCNLRDKVIDQMSSEIIKEIPKNVEQISKKQWQWILEKSHNDGQIRYKFCQKILEDLGFSSFGFHEKTHQPAITICNFSKVKEGFKILKPHLKLMTVEDRTKETGIRIEVHGLKEETTSILYVHKKGDIILYIDNWSTKKFKDFNEFADWYEEKNKQKEFDE